MPLWDMSDSTALTGTVEIADGNTTVVGTSTEFVDEVEIGDVLIVGTEEHRVTEVTNTTQLILGTEPGTDASGQSASVARRPTYLNITDTRNTFGVDAAERVAAEGDGKSGFHAGWVLKHQKTRRYANNDTYTVTWYETMVAAGSISDDLEDTVFPNV